MGTFDEVNVKIEGQVSYGNTKRKVLAELELVCSKYDLKLVED